MPYTFQTNLLFQNKPKLVNKCQKEKPEKHNREANVPVFLAFF